MKSIKTMHCSMIACAFLLSMSFVSCQKESVSNPSPIEQSVNNEDDVAAVSKTVDVN